MSPADSIGMTMYGSIQRLKANTKRSLFLGGTFNLALHTWYEPMERVTAAAQPNRIEMAWPMVGGTTHYGLPGPKGKWWPHAMLKN